MVVAEYKPVKDSYVDGVYEMSTSEFGERCYNDDGACFYPFFHMDRRIKVYVINPDFPEESMQTIEPTKINYNHIKKLYYPVNQWRDNSDLMKNILLNDEKVYLSTDGATAIVHNLAIARATGLEEVTPGGKFYAVDEYNKCTLELDVDEKMHFKNPRIYAEHGEYSIAVTDNNIAYIPDGVIYKYENGEISDYINLEDRPANVLVAGNQNEYLFISARTMLYVKKIK